jgi:nucleoid-associated protein YgaU
MADTEDQKNVVPKAAGLSNSEAALAVAKQELEAAQKNLVDLQVKAQTAPGSDKPKAYQAVEEAKKKLAEAEAKLNALAPQPAAVEFIAEHTLASDETLSHLALKYYGHATPSYWKVIYEANKELIGDNPNRVHSGMVIKVPKLPADFKA